MIDTSRAVTASFGKTHFQEETWNAYTKAKAALKEAELVLVRELANSSYGSTLTSMGLSAFSTSQSWNRNRTKFDFTDYGVNVTFEPNLQFSEHGKPNTFIPETTMNVLLTGKLLSDEEKRKLLQQQKYLVLDADDSDADDDEESNG